MKRIALWIAVFVVLSSLAFAFSICEDDMDIASNCTMVTPVVSCTWLNYSVYDSNGSLLVFGNLSAFADGTYYFNVSVGRGEYFSILCDDSFKQFSIGMERDKMFILGIVLLPLILIFGFLYWGSQLPEDNVLRLMFQLFVVPLAYLSIHFGVIALGVFYPELSDLVTALAEFTGYLGWVFFIVGAYLLYKLLKGLVDRLQQKKKDKEAETYGEGFD